MCSLHSLMLPVATLSPHPIYTLFRDPEGGMVEMGYQDETVEMEAKERGETLVCRDHLVCEDHLDHEVRKLTECHHNE